MSLSIVLFIFNIAWLLVIVSKRGREQFTYIVRLAVSILLVLLTAINLVFC